MRNLANSPIWYQIPLEKYPNGAELLITITDAATGKALRNAKIKKQRNKPEQGKLLINEWLTAGIKKIRVEIQQQKNGKTISVTEKLVNLESLSIF